MSIGISSQCRARSTPGLNPTAPDPATDLSHPHRPLASAARGQTLDGNVLPGPRWPQLCPFAAVSGHLATIMARGHGDGRRTCFCGLGKSVYLSCRSAGSCEAGNQLRSYTQRRASQTVASGGFDVLSPAVDRLRLGGDVALSVARPRHWIHAHIAHLWLIDLAMDRDRLPPFRTPNVERVG